MLLLVLLLLIVPHAQCVVEKALQRLASGADVRQVAVKQHARVEHWQPRHEQAERRLCAVALWPSSPYACSIVMPINTPNHRSDTSMGTTAAAGAAPR
jgi:hypothetical protein